MRARYGLAFRRSNCDLYSAPVTAVLYAMLCCTDRVVTALDYICLSLFAPMVTFVPCVSPSMCWSVAHNVYQEIGTFVFENKYLNLSNNCHGDYFWHVLHKDIASQPQGFNTMGTDLAYTDPTLPKNLIYWGSLGKKFYNHSPLLLKDKFHDAFYCHYKCNVMALIISMPVLSNWGQIQMVFIWKLYFRNILLKIKLFLDSLLTEVCFYRSNGIIYNPVMDK